MIRIRIPLAPSTMRVSRASRQWRSTPGVDPPPGPAQFSGAILRW